LGWIVAGPGNTQKVRLGRAPHILNATRLQSVDQSYCGARLLTALMPSFGMLAFVRPGQPRCLIRGVV
jgi:hypothetical protein